MATLANIFSYSDTLLLTDYVALDVLSTSLPVIMESLRSAQQRPQRFYAASAIANATCHPRLANVIKQNGGRGRIRIIHVFMYVQDLHL